MEQVRRPKTSVQMSTEMCILNKDTKLHNGEKIESLTKGAGKSG